MKPPKPAASARSRGYLRLSGRPGPRGLGERLPRRRLKRSDDASYFPFEKWTTHLPRTTSRRPRTPADARDARAPVPRVRDSGGRPSVSTAGVPEAKPRVVRVVHTTRSGPQPFVNHAEGAEGKALAPLHKTS